MEPIDREVNLQLRSDELLRQIKAAERDKWPLDSIKPLLYERQQIQRELQELRGYS